MALVPEKLDEPRRWRKPARVFVDSMSDLFHEALPYPEIARVFDVMLASPRHTFQVLTKRPRRMLGFVRDWWGGSDYNLLLNVWLGVSVEDQATADDRIPPLLQTPAARRFVSYEPALEPVDFRPWLGPVHPDSILDWVIVGGESGPGARPFDVAWARSVVAQCREAGVACFVKQLGAHPCDDPHRWQDWRCRSLGAVTVHDGRMWPALQHPKGADPSEWPADLRLRER